MTVRLGRGAVPADTPSGEPGRPQIPVDNLAPLADEATSYSAITTGPVCCHQHQEHQKTYPFPSATFLPHYRHIGVPRSHQTSTTDAS